jgi:hypothetical protein
MSWQISRLGSRFSLFFEPHHRRVMHSALGRLIDRPLDLMVGLIEPDGTERALPFSHRGSLFYNAEQFERPNSITFRGFSRECGLRFEFNVHSVFYPEDEKLCIMPAIYLEMRVNPAEPARAINIENRPKSVKLFLRLNRLDTRISAGVDNQVGHIDIAYKHLIDQEHPPVSVEERITSLNTGVEIEPDRRGLTLELPVTQVGSGTKWRLVWGAYCAGNVLHTATGNADDIGRFRYTRYFDNIDQVMTDAIDHRDDRLSRSRRFEKALEQAPLRRAQAHLLHQSFQTFLGSTFWCDRDTPDTPQGTEEWFSHWASRGQPDPSLEVEYHVALFYLTLWPALLAVQFDRWAQRERRHEESQGGFLYHRDSSPVEENAHFLLLLQAYTRWTGDVTIVCRHAELIQRLAAYEKWTDRYDCAFPTDGATAESESGNVLPRQTTTAIKRVAGLAAAADLLTRVEQDQLAAQLEALVQENVNKINHTAWVGDHYALSADRSLSVDYDDDWTDSDLVQQAHAAREAFSINTTGALLLSIMVGHAPLLDRDRLIKDLVNATRETLGPYGCCENSAEPDKLLISHNIWRDQLARYLGLSIPTYSQCYWDMQTMHNTGEQSLGFTDNYIDESLSFSPRGIVAIGAMLAYPRLIIDRLAPGGASISVDPDRHFNQRWPLLPLADWAAGKIPVCVVNEGQVHIENDADPVFIRGEQSTGATIG